MNPPINALVQAAGAAASQGRWQEAEQFWQRVRAIDPNHPQALYSLGVHAYRRGALSEALHTLQAAHTAAPRDPVVLLSVSIVLRDMGDISGELRAIDAALAADPYFLSGLLARAAHFEKHRGRKLAAQIYRDALKVAPPEPNWPDSLRSQLQHARQLVARHNEEMADFLADRMASRTSTLPPFEAERWREAGAIVSGCSQTYPSVCNRLLVPRLPAVPFFDRKEFPWVEELESHTEAITTELQELLRRDQGQFQPYVAYQPGAPLKQWHELNHSPRWSSFFLWRDGEPQIEQQQQCPVTTAALNKVEKADIAGLCPNAMFSALAPKTAIPPHHGETNARLVVHLPLIVPPLCSYRVGFERREWSVGKVLIFDDTIEHEARNDSEELRVVLIFDVWNPLLSVAERDMVRSLSAAMSEFYSQT